MPPSKSLGAYGDIRQLLDRALAAERGVAVDLPTPGKAVNFLQKVNYFRKLDRGRNQEIFPSDHPLFGRSIYDQLAISVEESSVRIEQLTVDVLEVRDL